jgi:hypothetical protein
MLADAFMNDPVFTFLRPGRLRRRARLRTMFVVEMEQYVLANGGTVWTTSGYDGAVAELPPGAWEMPKSATGKETLKWMWAFRTRLPRAIRVQRAMAKRHLREPHFYVRTVGCAPPCRDRAWDRCSCSRRWREPIRLDYRHTSRPAARAQEPGASLRTAT